MKKIFTTFLMVSFVLTAQGSLTLSINNYDENDELIITDIINDTTIVVSDYEEDFFTGSYVMAVNGSLAIASAPADLTIRIARQAEGIHDEFCLGTCISGNGEISQEIPLYLNNMYNQWFTHFYPTEPSITVVAYTFDDGTDSAITLTVKYCYEMEDTAVENIVSTNAIDGIYNLLGQRMPTDDINELSKGIYIVNGKKFVKN